MKRILIILAFIVFTCSKSNDDKPLNTTSIVGKWKWVESNDFFGTNNIPDGYTYTFNKDGTFVSDKFMSCSEGSYVMGAVTLTLVYNCDNVTSGNPPGTFIENYSFTNNRLHLEPTYKNCDEGCIDIFKKIAEPEDL